MQHHSIRQDITHVDLQALSLTETVRVPVNVVLVGTAPAVQEQGGVLMHTLLELEIEALPLDLVPVIEVDISNLNKIGDQITVADLDIPDTITVHNALDATVVLVTYQAEEEEAAEAVVAAEAGVPAEAEAEAEE